MKFKNGLKALINKYGHAWALLYVPVYLIWFMTLERKVAEDDELFIIETDIDELIPFCEEFIVPYYLWFAFIFVVGMYFFFTSKSEFYRLCIYLYSGMTVFLIICTFWHNGLELRPDLSRIGRDNIFMDLVRKLYETDTADNVFPSIHVYNSVCAAVAVCRNEKLRSMPVIKNGSVILAILIILSTVFLKQHSVLDVIAGLTLSILFYFPSYRSRIKWIDETEPLQRFA